MSEYLITSLVEVGDKFCVNGTCVCGWGANMYWVFTMEDGSIIPRCNKCKRGYREDADKYFRPISRVDFDYFWVKFIMES